MVEDLLHGAGISAPDALAEWRKLDATVSAQFNRKLAERLQRPRLPAARLAGHKDRYRIKPRSVGYRLVYEVRDAMLLVIVAALGKRKHNAVYRVAAKRQSQPHRLRGL